ncbi:MAG: hypothetical protein ACK5P4_03325, partial [Bacteroidota bacterium]
MKIKSLFITALLLMIVGLQLSRAACGSGQSEIIVNIVPDNWPGEISWDIKTGAGVLIASGNY